MLRVFAVILTFGLAGPGGYPPTPAPPSDFNKSDKAPKAERLWSQDITKIIKKADRINIYRLTAFAADPAAERPAGKQYFADYEVLDFNKVAKKQASKIKKILLDEKNYAKPGDANKCTFTAAVGLEIVSKKGVINVLVSYSCEKMLFLGDGLELYRDVKSLRQFDEVVRGLLKGQLG